MFWKEVTITDDDRLTIVHNHRVIATYKDLKRYFKRQNITDLPTLFADTRSVLTITDNGITTKTRFRIAKKVHNHSAVTK
jgi:hypothetical protein